MNKCNLWWLCKQEPYSYLIHFHFTFSLKLLVKWFTLFYSYQIRWQCEQGPYTAITFIQTCTFLFVTLIHLSKQDFVNSLTILFLYVYVQKLNWTKLVELSSRDSYLQRLYTMSYCYERTWAIMALLDSFVVRCIRLDDYNTCIFISWCCIFLTFNPQRFCVTALVGGYVPNLSHVFFFWFSYQAAHSFFPLYILIWRYQ